jgi:hypothetical protein
VIGIFACSIPTDYIYTVGMTRLQLAKIRQRVRELQGRRSTLEHVAMEHVPMVAASLIERRFPHTRAISYFLSIPTPQNSWHRYVRKDELDYFRRRAEAWREFVRAMAEWVRVNKEVETLLRRLGKGRCEKLEIRRGQRSRLHKRK